MAISFGGKIKLQYLHSSAEACNIASHAGQFFDGATPFFDFFIGF